MQSLLYTGVEIDRAAELRRDPKLLAEIAASSAARLLPYWRGRSLVAEGRAVAGSAEHMLRFATLAGAEPVFLGRSETDAWFTMDLSALDGDPDTGPNLGLEGSFVPLRSVGAGLPSVEAGLLAYARGLLHWRKRHRHCGACGAPMGSHAGGHLLRCTAPGCELEQFPRTDPAIIVLVTNGRHCLLGRQPQWPAGMYSCLAGFVEPGEALEQTVAREVREETGIAVEQARYAASQPWPFPASLMIGFEASAEKADPVIDRHELEDARWFSRDEIAGWAPGGQYFLPRADSIARWLLDRWLMKPDLG